MKSETELTNELCKELRSKGCVTMVLAGGRYAQRGRPDRFITHFLLRGGVFVEFKGADTAIEPLQRNWNKQLRNAGTPACFARFVDEMQIRVFADDTDSNFFGRFCDNDAASFLTKLREYREAFYCHRFGASASSLQP